MDEYSYGNGPHPSLPSASSSTYQKVDDDHNEGHAVAPEQHDSRGPISNHETSGQYAGQHLNTTQVPGPPLLFQYHLQHSSHFQAALQQNEYFNTQSYTGPTTMYQESFTNNPHNAMYYQQNHYSWAHRPPHTGPQYISQAHNSVENYGESNEHNTSVAAATSEERSSSPESTRITGEPYKDLIYKALLSAPGHRMVLKDLYQWFEEHTDKTTKGGRGWQNSIRHNLSMNDAFEQVDGRSNSEDTKRHPTWKLSARVLATGKLQSTTRFRKPAIKRETLPSVSYRINGQIVRPQTAQSIYSAQRLERFLQDGNNVNFTDSLAEIKQENFQGHATMIHQPNFQLTNNWSYQPQANDARAFQGPVPQTYMDQYAYPNYNSQNNYYESSYTSHQPTTSLNSQFERYSTRYSTQEEEYPTPSLTAEASSFTYSTPGETGQLREIPTHQMPASSNGTCSVDQSVYQQHVDQEEEGLILNSIEDSG